MNYRCGLVWMLQIEKTNEKAEPLLSLFTELGKAAGKDFHNEIHYPALRGAMRDNPVTKVCLSPGCPFAFDQDEESEVMIELCIRMLTEESLVKQMHDGALMHLEKELDKSCS